jgi:ComF family protein
MNIRTAGGILRLGLSSARQALLPDCCVLCGLSLRNDSICRRCRDLLPLPDRGCERCAAALPAAQAPEVHCGHCQSDPPMFRKAVAALKYAFPVDSALKAYKFNAQLHYAPAFASLLLPLLESEFADADALLPVPLHRWRHAERGFNQAAEIAGILASSIRLPMLRTVRRIRATPSQSGLDAAARRRNLKGAFALGSPLRCRRPVIVDDVMTTGETCRQISRLLVEAGAESVGVLVVARA